MWERYRQRIRRKTRGKMISICHALGAKQVATWEQDYLLPESGNLQADCARGSSLKDMSCRAKFILCPRAGSGSLVQGGSCGGLQLGQLPASQVQPSPRARVVWTRSIRVWYKTARRRAVKLRTPHIVMHLLMRMRRAVDCRIDG